MNDQTKPSALAQRVNSSGAVLRASEVRDHVNLIQELLASVMKAEVHYGVIPGTKKPTLYKPGAEKILMMFQLAPKLRIEDLSAGGAVRYRITTDLESLGGRVVGTGVGEASSEEEKYAWRAAVCQEEFDATPETLRRVKWKKGWQDKPNEAIKQIHTNVPDIANTILKMAAKRSLIHVTLTATAASDAFEQDLEDMPAEILQREVERENARHPGKAAGDKVEAEVSPERRAKVVAAMEATLKAGAPFGAAWALMSVEDRRALGKVEKERLLKLYPPPKPAGASGPAGEPAAGASGASGPTGPSGSALTGPAQPAGPTAAHDGKKSPQEQSTKDWVGDAFPEDDGDTGRVPGAD